MAAILCLLATQAVPEIVAVHGVARGESRVSGIDKGSLTLDVFDFVNRVVSVRRYEDLAPGRHDLRFQEMAEVAYLYFVYLEGYELPACEARVTLRSSGTGRVVRTRELGIGKVGVNFGAVPLGKYRVALRLETGLRVSRDVELATRNEVVRLAVPNPAAGEREGR